MGTIEKYLAWIRYLDKRVEDFILRLNSSAYSREEKQGFRSEIAEHCALIRHYHNEITKGVQ
jgi:hypothetical protein